jgi:hypothetical protein
MRSAAAIPSFLYDEFDSSGERWMHRLLFWRPYKEVSIYFGAFTLKVIPASDRLERDRG